MNLRFYTVFLAFALTACGGGNVQMNPNMQVVENAAMPAPQVADLAAFSRPYVFGPYDKLAIEVFGVPELSRPDVQIDASGRLSYPLAGEIDASGKTPNELADEIEARLRGSYVRDPQVTVNLRETVSQVLTVYGQVNAPGLYPVIGRMTLMRAVATAKGLSEFAKEEDIVVFRTVNGQRMAALYNLQAIRRGYYEDPDLYANDIVVVDDSKARRLFRDLITIAPILTYPLIQILQP